MTPQPQIDIEQKNVMRVVVHKNTTEKELYDLLMIRMGMHKNKRVLNMIYPKEYDIHHMNAIFYVEIRNLGSLKFFNNQIQKQSLHYQQIISEIMNIKDPNKPPGRNNVQGQYNAN